MEEAADVEEEIVAVYKMKNCPICYQKLFSDIGKGCKMCGMPLEGKGTDFCCRICRAKFNKIKKERMLKKMASQLSELNLIYS